MSAPCPCGHDGFGYKLEGRTLSKTVKASEHMLRLPPAWAVQKSVLDAHQDVETIVITDSESGAVYSVSMGQLRVYSFPITRGHGEQIGLALAYWTVNDKPGKGEGSGLQLGLL